MDASLEIEVSLLYDMASAERNCDRDLAVASVLLVVQVHDNSITLLIGHQVKVYLSQSPGSDGRTPSKSVEGVHSNEEDP
jgi:hypothetical protein